MEDCQPADDARHLRLVGARRELRFLSIGRSPNALFATQSGIDSFLRAVLVVTDHALVRSSAWMIDTVAASIADSKLATSVNHLIFCAGGMDGKIKGA